MHLSELIGQTRATTVLRNAIRRDRVAHAYLFRGPEGVGKSTAARLFAQALNCEDPSRKETGDACGQCRSCQLIAAGSHPDVWTVTLMVDKGKLKTEISIHQVRRDPKRTNDAPRPIVQDAILRPLLGRHKVYIIDPADKMSVEAENALLKLLEEPPPYVVLVLVGSQPAALLPTILSRCQPVTFQLAGTAAVEAHLQAMGLEPGAAASLAELSGGRVGWALSAARQPEVLEVRQGLLELCERMEAMGVAESLRAAEDLKQQAMQLAEARASSDDEEEDEGEDGVKSAPSGAAPSKDRALRAELPWCLEVMALWYREALAAAIAADARGRHARHYERAVELLFAAKERIQRNANLDLALEALAIGLTARSETGPV